MTSVFVNVPGYSRFNLSESTSDIQIFINEYKERIKTQLEREEENKPTPFVSFAEKGFFLPEESWIKTNYERFFKDTPNEFLAKSSYLSELGYICSAAYSHDGSHVVVGHSSGLIQAALTLVGHEPRSKMMKHAEQDILFEYARGINHYYGTDKTPKPWYRMFSRRGCDHHRTKDLKRDWVKENYDRFLKDTPNEILFNRWFYSSCGFMTSLAFSHNGHHIIAGFSTGLIQMRHGLTGTVLCTLRNCQFPPKPVHSLEYSTSEERVCYAACTDGTVYRIEVPDIDTSVVDPPEYCIRADPALESLNTQFFGGPGTANFASAYITQRSPALSMGLTADRSNLIVGYGDASIKVYDTETKEAVLTYKVHKLRLQFIPKKLQRLHSGQVCALRCHPGKTYCFASGAWDNTLRVWDTRCPIGCMMTFEGVNICHDSIDLCREQAISGSWTPTEALSLWDLTARKRISIVRVQNRRFDVDGGYVYACRYWRSNDFNRKGKYGIIGGSGTKCVEVINLHNRYITCSYPTPGTTLAVASYGERIAFGGTAPVFTIVKFHDPKHEKYVVESDSDYDYTKAEIIYDDEKTPTVTTTGRSSDSNVPDVKK